MSEAQMRRISYLRSIVKDRDAEIERLRAALQDVYMTTRCDKTAAKALAALGFTPVPDDQPPPGKEEA